MSVSILAESKLAEMAVPSGVTDAVAAFFPQP
jgi:hypothetical protein